MFLLLRWDFWKSYLKLFFSHLLASSPLFSHLLLTSQYLGVVFINYICTSCCNYWEWSKDNRHVPRRNPLVIKTSKRSDVPLGSKGRYIEQFEEDNKNDSQQSHNYVVIINSVTQTQYIIQSLPSYNYPFHLGGKQKSHKTWIFSNAP